MAFSPETAADARSRGFTLIELLVVVAIGIVLVAMLLPVAARSRDMARMAREQASGRALMLGVLNYAEEHDGEMFHGYCRHPQDVSAFPIKPFMPEEAHRYPLRLLQYIGSYDKRVLVADLKGWYRSMDELSDSEKSYFVSLFPTFGMNAVFVGGDESGNDMGGIKPIPAHFDRYGKFCITQMGEAQTPSRQVVFVSSRFEESGQKVNGYFKVLAPKLPGRSWSPATDASESTAATDFGYVDLRYNNKAVVVHLDGHVEMLALDALRDMRRWSNQAAIANDPNFNVL